jgi:hypothetical protein
MVIYVIAVNKMKQNAVFVGWQTDDQCGSCYSVRSSIENGPIPGRSSMYETQSQFLHRPIADDCYISICVRCSCTAGSGLEGPELEEAEKNHVCRKEALRARAEMAA